MSRVGLFSRLELIIEPLCAWAVVARPSVARVASSTSRGARPGEGGGERGGNERGGIERDGDADSGSQDDACNGRAGEDSAYDGGDGGDGGDSDGGDGGTHIEHWSLRGRSRIGDGQRLRGALVHALAWATVSSCPAPVNRTVACFFPWIAHAARARERKRVGDIRGAWNQDTTQE